MDDNSLLMIVLAFVVGYMASGMMRQMCGGRLIEGKKKQNLPNCEPLPNLITGRIVGESDDVIRQNNRDNIDHIHRYLAQGECNANY